jgi:hypothetical protein
VSAALQALARALPDREVYLRAVAPAFGESHFRVVIVDGAGTSYRVTITGLPDHDANGAVRFIAAELLREHRDLVGDAEARALNALLDELGRMS